MARIWRDAESGYEVVRGPSVGDPGPEFALNRMDGSGEVQLANLRDKPTVLVFGSFT
jgi:peroxiredoxin